MPNVLGIGSWDDSGCQGCGVGFNHQGIICPSNESEYSLEENMNMKPFNQIFEDATSFQPFTYQETFANTIPSLVKVPTGLGKTAAVVLGWLWRRRFADESIRATTPTRLVYCLPMRVLVEQTYSCVSEWIQKLDLQDSIKVHVIMGGEDIKPWDIHPEQEVILIGTQDMLLSRALNRGYALSRYRWPIAFGLLNNDCLWVMDEVQLMDASLQTSSQLDGFRKQLNVYGACQTVWMSATLENAWLKTIDSDSTSFENILHLEAADINTPEVQKRWEAYKHVGCCESVIGESTSIASEIVTAHQADSLTLAIFNTVERAKEVFKETKKQCNDVEILLLHSRFRQQDRERIVNTLLSPIPSRGRIVISTQVIEAGIDISAQTLFTELAPWASLVQRFGRCNRKGEFNEKQSAVIYWINLPKGEKEKAKLSLPYTHDELINALDLLQKLSKASPFFLDQLRIDNEELYRKAMTIRHEHVIRKRDLIDLFDTTPDLAGSDVDISRFIRSDESKDVQVFWRTWEDCSKPDAKDRSGAPSRREELCAVPIGQFAEFYKKYKGRKFILKWDELSEAWNAIEQENIYPGQVFLIHSSLGGYSSEMGWIGQDKKTMFVEPIVLEDELSVDGYESDQYAELPWRSIAEHTDHVVAEMDSILQSVPIDEDIKPLLLQAARWHDRGKAHPVFQQAIQDGGGAADGEQTEKERPEEWKQKRNLAKAPKEFWKRYERHAFRHELASALAILQAGLPDFAAYLAAAHHGKVRLSIRSMPNEKPPESAERLFARGIYDEDILPEMNLGGGVIAPEVKLSLQCMQLGRDENNQPSWAERILKLRDQIDPFRLAYLEALIRAADMRASAKENENAEASK